MKTTCLYENEEFGNTVRDILLDKKIQTETARATEAENRLKDNIATSTVTGLKISENNVIQLIGLNDKVIAEATLNIKIPAGIKTISLNGTKLTLAYTNDSSQECDLASLLTEVKRDIDREQSRALSAEETLQGNIDDANMTIAELEERLANLEQRVTELHQTSDN